MYWKSILRDLSSSTWPLSERTANGRNGSQDHVPPTGTSFGPSRMNPPTCLTGDDVQWGKRSLTLMKQKGHPQRLYTCGLSTRHLSTPVLLPDGQGESQGISVRPDLATPATRPRALYTCTTKHSLSTDFEIHFSGLGRVSLRCGRPPHGAQAYRHAACACPPLARAERVLTRRGPQSMGYRHTVTLPAPIPLAPPIRGRVVG